MNTPQDTPNIICNREAMAGLLGIDPCAMPVLMSLGCPVIISGGNAPAQDTYDAKRVLDWVRRVRAIGEKPTMS